MSSSHNRMQRIGDQIQRELAQLVRTKVNDPRFQTLSITAVDVSPDMANATVLVSQLDEKQITETLAALNKAAGFFRRELAQALNLRVTPRIRFAYDKSIAHGVRLSALINTVTKEQDEEPTGE